MKLFVLKKVLVPKPGLCNLNPSDHDFLLRNIKKPFHYYTYIYIYTTLIGFFSLSPLFTNASVHPSSAFIQGEVS